MTPDDRPTGPEEAAATRDAAHAQLEVALDVALGGFRLLDQGLELSDGGLVHLLGVDGHGALVLVLLVSEDDQETLARGLEVLELVLDHGPVLHHHLSGGHFAALGLDPHRAPRLLLVGEAFAPARVRRLTSLCNRQEEVELFELRSLRTAAGESLYLHRLAGRPSRDGSAAPPSAPETLVRSPRGDLMDLLVQRLRGLDPGLETSGTASVRTWSQGGSALVEARSERDGSLVVRLRSGERERVLSVRELDAFLERVVSAYLRGLGGA